MVKDNTGAYGNYDLYSISIKLPLATAENSVKQKIKPNNSQNIKIRQIHRNKMTQIQLYIHNTWLKRGIFMIYINSNKTIKDLQNVICKKMGKNPIYTRICLSIRNLKPLIKEHLTLIDYGIINLTSISVTFVTELLFPIHIYVYGKVYTLKNMRNTDKILHIKQKIKMLFSIPIRFQTLKYNDTELLNNSNMLSICNIKANTMLKVTVPTEFQIFNTFVLDKRVSIIHINKDYVVATWQDPDQVHELFLQTMHEKIDRVSVFKIKHKYQQNVKIYRSVLSLMKNQKQDMLFHGTSFENIINIMHNGFNRDFNVTSWYGKGTYFAKHADFAADYCTKHNKYDYYAMLCCNVIIGESGEGREHMSDSELYNNGKQYDSLVNDLDNPTIFVINRDYHAIPVYILLFNYKPEPEEEDDDDDDDDDVSIDLSINIDDDYPDWKKYDIDHDFVYHIHNVYSLLKAECNTDNFHDILRYDALNIADSFYFQNSKKVRLYYMPHHDDADEVLHSEMDKSMNFVFYDSVELALVYLDPLFDIGIYNQQQHIFVCDVYLSNKQQDDLQQRNQVVIKGTQMHRIKWLLCANIDRDILRVSVFDSQTQPVIPWAKFMQMNTDPMKTQYATLKKMNDHKLNGKTVKMIKQIKRTKKWKVKIVNSAAKKQMYLLVKQDKLDTFSNYKPINIDQKKQLKQYTKKRNKNIKCTKLYHNKKCLNKYIQNRGYSRRGNWRH